MINATLGGNSVGSMKSLHDFTKCRGVSKKKTFILREVIIIGHVRIYEIILLKNVGSRIISKNRLTGERVAMNYFIVM